MVSVDVTPSEVRIKDEHSANEHDSSRAEMPLLGSTRTCEVSKDKAGTYGLLRQTYSPLNIEDASLQIRYLGETTSNVVLSNPSPQNYFHAQPLQYPSLAAQYNRPDSLCPSMWVQSDRPLGQVGHASTVQHYSSDLFSAYGAAIMDGLTILPRHVDPGIQPSSYVWDIPIKLMAPTCILDSILITTIHQQRTLALSGASQLEVSGPKTFNMPSLFDPQKGAFSHPVSRAWTDYATNMTYISTKPLADILAVLLLAYRLQRVCNSFSKKSQLTVTVANSTQPKQHESSPLVGRPLRCIARGLSPSMDGPCSVARIARSYYPEPIKISNRRVSQITGRYPECTMAVPTGGCYRNARERDGHPSPFRKLYWSSRELVIGSRSGIAISGIE